MNHDPESEEVFPCPKCRARVRMVGGGICDAKLIVIHSNFENQQKVVFLPDGRILPDYSADKGTCGYVPHECKPRPVAK